MAVYRIALTEDEQRVVNAERDSQPEPPIRRKTLVVWLLHCCLTRAKAAEIAGVSSPPVLRDAAAYRNGGLDGPCIIPGPVAWRTLRMQLTTR
jgi:hypothetical protein